MIFESCRSRNHIFLFKYTVKQLQNNIGSLLRHCNNKSLTFFFLCIVQRRHSGNGIGMIQNFERIETKICCKAAVRVADLNHIITEITDTTSRNFLRKCIKRIFPVRACFLRISCKSHIRTENQTGKIFLTDFFSIVEMQKHIFVICEHLVTAVFCLEGK